MASTASISSAGSTASASNSLSQTNGAGKPAMKPAASKAAETGSKQTASPIDAAQKRPQKAWTSGTNPITQKPAQNGVISQPKASATKSAQMKESHTADKHASDRLLYILGAAVGTSVTITTKADEKFEGIFSSSDLDTNDHKVTICMARTTQSTSETQANGVKDQAPAFAGFGPNFALTFSLRELANISIPELSTLDPSKSQNGTSSNFRTDADISGNQNRAERELQRWVPEPGAELNLSLESTGATGWDQFETNNRLFGTSSTYDENIYTTRIDRSAPSYRQREAEAARVARDIEGSTSGNRHLREERGQAHEEDCDDEEDKYSGVRRDDSNFPPLASGAPNRYMPPARRAPTAQPTVAGAPVDPAIISAQVAKPEREALSTTMANDKSSTVTARHEATQQNLATNVQKADEASKSTAGEENKTTQRSITSSVSPERRDRGDGPTEGIENKLLHAFHHFSNQEKMKLEDAKRSKAKQDRQAKLNDLLRFSKTFKLDTPVPKDLVGILAKDPGKQDQIVQKAQKDLEENTSTTASPASQESFGAEAKAPVRSAALQNFDRGMVPAPIPKRGDLVRGRQPYATVNGRTDRSSQPQAIYAGRGQGLFSHRNGGLQQDRTLMLAQNIPKPIPILDSRPLPQGPSADQSTVTSPQRSVVHTPTSSVSAKFNVKASEFKPNAAAPAFNPGAPSNAPSSPRSKEGTSSASRATTPSQFFGSRKPKPARERLSIIDNFNPIKRMRKEAEEQKEQKEQTKRDFSANGGIPWAYSTAPVWMVAAENQEKTYIDLFERMTAPAASPARSVRSTSSQQIPYHQQVPMHLQNGMSASPSQQGTQNMHVQLPTPHLEEPHRPIQMSAGAQMVYPSPRMPSGQMAYGSPMGHPAQLAYGQPMQYFPVQGGPVPMQMRQYSAGPQFMTQAGQLAAPMMVQQQSGGPYLGMPPQYNTQMYPPNPGHVYPNHMAQQPNSGYPSPGRAAPMMMHQGSQQGHQPQPAMYGQMGYQQQVGSMMRGGYQHSPYGSSPHQVHHFPPQPQRMPSSGYGHIPQQKMMPQQMQQPQGVPGSGPHQPAGFVAEEDAK